MSNLVRFLYQLARTMNDIEKFSSGDPKKITRRIKNKIIGRKIGSKIYRWPKI
ncbi:MAG TPA: hypothetical protein PK303_02955 [bacterium]|nr:hypothetical protein [bacterium]HOL34523.1 hypothetical protein [bacterium]HPP08065.1 hypothetical protein [bacterium]